MNSPARGDNVERSEPRGGAGVAGAGEVRALMLPGVEGGFLPSVAVGGDVENLAPPGPLAGFKRPGVTCLFN